MTTFHAEWTIPNEVALRKWASRFSSLLEQGGVVLLEGPLGAGKTTLVKALGQSLGVSETMTSPTFDLLHLHAARDLCLWHLDGYRLTRLDEWDMLDLPGPDQGGTLILAEWGEPMKGLYPERWELTLSFDGISDHARYLSVGAVGDALELRLRTFVKGVGDGI